MPQVILRPNGNGVTTTFDAFGQATQWECVNEVVANEDTDYIYDINSAHGFFTLTDRGIGEGVINSVTVYGRFKHITTIGNFRLRLYNDGSYGSTGNIATTGSYVTHSNNFGALSLKTSLPWTWAEIDSLQGGVTLLPVAGEYRCTQTYVVVDFTPTPPAAGRCRGFIFG